MVHQHRAAERNMNQWMPVASARLQQQHPSCAVGGEAISQYAPSRTSSHHDVVVTSSFSQIEKVERQPGSRPVDSNQLAVTGERYIGGFEVVATEADVGRLRIR